MLVRHDAVKALIVKDGKALLLWDPNYIYKDKWEPPGGRKKPGESDSDALLRETKEETGIEIRILRHINDWKVELPERNMLIAGKTYLCEALTADVKLNDKERQHTKFRWIPLEEAKHLYIVPWLKEAINKL